jgi:hypothetical protein
VTVNADGSISPVSIISGKRIRPFDNSSGSGEVIFDMQFYINEHEHATANSGSSYIYVTSANTKFVVDDTVFLNGTVPTPFSIGVMYWVVVVTSTYIRLSASKSGSAITASSTSSAIDIYMGTDSYPYYKVRPFPAASASLKEGVFVATGSTAAADGQSIYFRVDPTEVTKPTVSSNYHNYSLFIYNRHPADGAAMLVNRRQSTADGVHLFYTKLNFANFMNKVGTAAFTIVNPGDATSAELDLLLAGSATYHQKENLVAIIQDSTVVWSGKITKSEQDKTSQFEDPSFQTFNITCESDIIRMKTQLTKAANRGEKRDKIGAIVTSLVEADTTNDVDWNLQVLGNNRRRGFRSSEGIVIDYNITEADMFTQFMILSKTLDFDWRTYLNFARYTYSRSSSTYTVSGTFGTDAFNGLWVIYVGTDGSTQWGTISDTTSTTIVATSSSTPAASGTLLVIMDPVLDMLGDLRTPDPVQTFRMNAQPWATGGNGYGFNDKTDRTKLATKIVAKAKTSEGSIISTSVAALEPWSEQVQKPWYATYINKRTESRIIYAEVYPEISTTNLYLEGWGYDFESYYAIYLADGTYMYPQEHFGVDSADEIYYNGKRVTKLVDIGYLHEMGDASVFVGGMVIAIKDADLGTEYGSIYNHYWPNPYARLYIETPCWLSGGVGSKFWINGEVIEANAIGFDGYFGAYISFLCDDTAYHRDHTDPNFEAHTLGTLVFDNDYYDETAPTTTSPAYYHGLLTQTYTADIGVSKADLQKYATAYLLANSSYLRKATFWCTFNEWYKSDVRADAYELLAAGPPLVGEMIACYQDTNATLTETLYGDYKNQWQIVSWSFDIDTMIVTVELGDFERNVFTTITDKTSALQLSLG